MPHLIRCWIWPISFIFCSGCVRGFSKDTLYAFYLENKEFLEQHAIHLESIAKPDGTVFIDQTSMKPIKFSGKIEKEIAFQTDSRTLGVLFSEIFHKVFHEERTTAAQRDALTPIFIRYASLFFSDGSSWKLLARHLAPDVPGMSADKLQNLFQEVHHALREKYPRVQGLTNKVMILTGPYGGGHESAAGAFKEALDGLHPGEIVQTCDYEGKGLFYKIYGQDTKSCELTKKVHAGKSDFDLFLLLRNMNETLKNYEFQDKWVKIMELIKAQKPGLLISTIHHIREVSLIALMTGIPLRIFITDFENPHAQSDLVNFYDPEEVMLWLPSQLSGQFESFRNFFDRDPRSKTYGRTKVIHDSILQGAESWVPSKDALEVFSLMPFPVLSVFTKKIDRKQARQTLGLPPVEGQKTVTLMYGSSGSGKVPLRALESLIRAHGESSQKLEILFLSVGNAELKKGAADLFKKYKVGSPSDIFQRKCRPFITFQTWFTQNQEEPQLLNSWQHPLRCYLFCHPLAGRLETIIFFRPSDYPLR
jgi:hypothetical protein